MRSARPSSCSKSGNRSAARSRPWRIPRAWPAPAKFTRRLFASSALSPPARWRLFSAAAQMAAHQPVPRGGRILVMTSSGAGASLMADKASEYGIELADISEEAKARIPQRRTAILTNPFDTAGASRSPGFLSSVCEAFAADTANDCLLMYLGPLAVRHEYARNFAAASEKFGKTAAAIIMLSEPDVRDIFQDAPCAGFRRRDRRLLPDAARLYRLRPVSRRRASAGNTVRQYARRGLRAEAILRAPCRHVDAIADSDRGVAGPYGFKCAAAFRPLS